MKWGIFCLFERYETDACEAIHAQIRLVEQAEDAAMLDILSHGRLNLGLAKEAFASDFKHFNTTTEHLRPKFLRTASSFNKSLRFDQTRYQALIQERNVFFDGQKFFENGIIGDAQRCIDTCLTIQKRFPKVHVALKLLGTNENENARLLHDFTRLVRPFVDKAHHG